MIDSKKVIDSDKLIDAINNGSYDINLTAIMALGATLIENNERNRRCCEYCHEDSDGYVKPIEKNCHAFIRFGMEGWELSLKANGWHGSAKIRYCPMCGRELKHG